jgi:prepilin-type N-terminal cleavage/methylation domain-containing protein
MNGSVDKLPRASRGHCGGLRKRGSPRALTLVELLVVLTILAILTTVAVVSTETVLRQGRFEATQRTLQAIEEAVLGPGLLQSEDGTPATAGFVADIGRLPLDLSELWDPGDLPPFEFTRASAANLPSEDAELADPDLVVPCGWRGPYVRLPVGAEELLDGWGNPFDAIVDYDGDNTLVVAAVRSLGADGLPGSMPEDPYSSELEVVFFERDSLGKVIKDRAHTSIQITVWQRGEDGLEVPSSGLEEPSSEVEVQVRLFGPDNGGVGVWQQSLHESPWTFEFENVPIGPHVIRAYEINGDDRRSAPLQIQVHPLRSTTWRLVIE